MDIIAKEYDIVPTDELEPTRSLHRSLQDASTDCSHHLRHKPSHTPETIWTAPPIRMNASVTSLIMKSQRGMISQIVGNRLKG